MNFGRLLFFLNFCTSFWGAVGFYRKIEKVEDKSVHTGEKIVEAILAFYSDCITPEQRELLDAWLQESAEHQALFEEFEKEELWGENLYRFRRFDSHKDWRRVAPGRKRNRFARRLWGVAAGIALLLTAGWAVYRFTGQADVKENPEELLAVKHAVPRARLHVGEGVIIPLEGETQPERLSEDLSIRNREGKLVYEDLPEGAAIGWHRLEVPRGAEYKLQLPDGTDVILNAETELRYPNRFDGDERRVEISGEAYFDVASDPDHPFIVVAGDMEVCAVGTAFNVSAYPNENRRATLVSGKVIVACDENRVEMLPGKQLTWDGENYRLRDVSVESYIAWRDQRFVFDDELLEEILRKLERWYDIRTVFRSPSLKEIRFTGNLPKYEDIDKVLNKLEMAAHVRFELQGRTLIVEKE